MLLLIDWGNTCLKYVFIKGVVDPISNVTPFKIESANSLTEFILALKSRDFNQAEPLTKVFVTSVKSKEDDLKLRNELLQLGLVIEFAKTSREACGVTCGYENPALLGVDRWLAIIAAYQSGLTTGIIDVGSAITLDLVNGVGRHLGGHIVPGVRLMNKSLTNTANVKVSGKQTSIKYPILGNTTTDCVNAGIESLIMGYLVQSIKSFSAQYGVNRWIMTGGGGKYYLNQLKILDFLDGRHQLTCDQNLVFKGLLMLLK